MDYLGKLSLFLILTIGCVSQPEIAGEELAGNNECNEDNSCVVNSCEPNETFQVDCTNDILNSTIARKDVTCNSEGSGISPQEGSCELSECAVGFKPSSDGSHQCEEEPIIAGDIFEAFDSSVLPAGFSIENSNQFNYQVDNGHLEMSLNNCNDAVCVWFRQNAGPMVYTNYTGNFKVTTLVRVKDSLDPTQSLPLLPYGFLFAGLIARDPASSNSGVQENYVFSVIGLRGAGQYTNELKTTVNDTSTVWEKSEYLSTLNTLDAEIRICRIDQLFQFYVKESGSWVKVNRDADRSENPLPDTLQLGMIVYDYYTDDRIQGNFDYFRVQSISNTSECLVD